MEVSNTSMKVARVTVSAINQGLCLGCHPSTEEWCTRRATGFGCGASVAVTNAYPGDRGVCSSIVRSFRTQWYFHPTNESSGWNHPEICHPRNLMKIITTGTASQAAEKLAVG